MWEVTVRKQFTFEPLRSSGVSSIAARFFTRCARLLLVSGLLSIWAFCLAAHAQSKGSLKGSVKDVTHAVIQGATVELKNVETGVLTRKKTDSNGLFYFVDVLPGRYTLSASAAGFATELEPEFSLEVNQTATVDFSMHAGSASSTVEVTTQSIQLETSTAELGTVIGTHEVESLPLNGRNFSELLLLTPGASSTNPLQNSGGPPGAIGTVVMPALNGQSNRSNMFWLDGVSNYGASND